jgi:spermidine synthase
LDIFLRASLSLIGPDGIRCFPLAYRHIAVQICFSHDIRMNPSEILGQATAPDGAVLKLVRRGRDYLILADDAVLMTSRMHGSEESLAELGCRQARGLERPCVLIGGLGMGFTLRATLDLLPSRAIVVVAELSAAVVEWNRGPLGPLAGNPLEDQRVQVEMGDVAALLRACKARFDAILLDVDNGPADLASTVNVALYGSGGIASARAALRPGGILAVWAVKNDVQFVQRLRRGGFEARIERARAHATRGARHIIFLGSKL